MSELRLDVDTHTYWLGEKRLPSVTQALSVIESYDHVPAEILDRARRFGQHVHTTIDYFNRGELDEDSLDPELGFRLAQYKNFLHDTRFKVIQSEQKVHSASLGFAGTLDIIGILKRWDALIDLKSGAVPRSVGPQTAAYREASIEKPRKRYALKLWRDGYKLIPCEDPSDFSIFLSALNVYRFQRRSYAQLGRPEDTLAESA